MQSGVFVEELVNGIQHWEDPSDAEMCSNINYNY